MILLVMVKVMPKAMELMVITRMKKHKNLMDYPQRRMLLLKVHCKEKQELSKVDKKVVTFNVDLLEAKECLSKDKVSKVWRKVHQTIQKRSCAR